MLYTDKEILRTISEAGITLCDVIFHLVNDGLKDSEAFNSAVMLHFQLKAVAEMCIENICDSFPEEYDD